MDKNKKRFDRFDPEAAREKYIVVKQPRQAGRMIEVEGYKAFFGMMDCGGRNVYGEWLYKPGTDCWYCRGSSYPAEICRILSVE